MKRWIHSSEDTQIEYVLNIVVDIAPEPYKIAAADLKDPLISKEKKLSKEQFERLKSVVSKILELVNHYEFKVLEDYQSPKSYSYYIRFIPTDDKGKEWNYVAKIQFEVRDHSRNDGNDTGWVSNEMYVQVFNVGNKQCFDTTTTILEARKILDQLKKGDYSSLEPIPCKNLTDPSMY